MKRCFPSLIIRECKSEPQWDTPLTAMRMPITKQNKTENSTCWRGYRESGSFVHCWWGCKMCNSWGKMDGGFSKSYRQNCRRSSNCTSRCILKRIENTLSLKNMYINASKVETTQMFTNWWLYKNNVKCCSAIEKNAVVIRKITWLNLENIMLSERSQTQSHILYG